MPVRLLNVFTDENPELQKQIGCMTGIFQMFYRQQLLHGRRFSELTPGHALLDNNRSGGKRFRSPKIVPGKKLNKSLSETSPRASFSSSSGSSFSSLDCNTSTKQEVSSFSRTIVPEKSLMDSPRLKGLDSDSRSNCHRHCRDLPNESVRSSGQPLDFKDLVKDSIYRDTRGLSVKASTKEEVQRHILRHRGSPKSMHSSKPMNVIGTYGRSGMPDNLNESLKVLTKLKEAPWNSYEAKDASFYPREAPRLSYDGREMLRTSMDSQENVKSGTKLKELPRLSLDSREGYRRNFSMESRADSLLKDKYGSNVDQHASTSVVAKLMGLEAMPNFNSVPHEPINLVRTNTKKDSDLSNGLKDCSMFSKSPRLVQNSQHDRLSRSPKSSFNDSSGLKLNKHNSDLKPNCNSRISIEAASWKQQERVHVPRKAAVGYREAHAKQQTELVYSKLERRLKELEFQHPNKNLKALEQILDVMQAKVLLETKKGEEKHFNVSCQKNFGNPNPTGGDDRNKIHPVPVFAKAVKSRRASESPIVIMKPAKCVNKASVNALRAIPFKGLPSILRIRTTDAIDGRQASTKIQMAKDRILEESSNDFFLSTDKKTKENSSQKVRLQMAQASSRPQQSPRENGGSSVKSTSSLSPRQQQRKIELENKLGHRVSPSELDKTRKQLSYKQLLDSVSPRGKLRPKPGQVQCNAGQHDAIYHESYSSMCSASQLDVEVTREQCSQSPSGRVAVGASSRLEQKKALLSSKQDVSTKNLGADVPEQQPSPISVLDASFYGDDLPPSPVKKISNAFKDVDTQTSDNCWTPIVPSDELSSKLSSQINQKKLEHIDELVQTRRRLTSTDDEPCITEKIALLCETQNPDHKYISEILVASGLLKKDPAIGSMNMMGLQLHPSGHPINPDLFLVLEQMKMNSLSNPHTEKLHRKLVFDLVNEILVDKLELTSPLPRLGVKKHKDGQPLLKDLCYEIELLQRQRLNGDCFNDENSISAMGVLCQLELREDYGREVPGVILEIERSIFKDLINEIVSGETVSCLQVNRSRRCRQLFKQTN